VTGDLAGAVITMIDTTAGRTERANAAQQVLTFIYAGNPVPAVWPGSRVDLIEQAREIRGLRPTSLASGEPGGTVTSDEEPA
jgi:hypothetical protein